MIRIVALNDTESVAFPENETSSTNEAQEAIAEFEYIRAIGLIHEGKKELALSLLNYLLETKVLNEVQSASQNEKLWAVRYNSHKNIALIYEKQANNQKALQSFVSATIFDDSDVHTMTHFGRLAYEISALEIAEFAYDCCLRQNPRHWSAADGELRLLCQNYNILGAYALGLIMHSKDFRYNKSLNVITDINHIFFDTFPFLEKIWGQPQVITDNRKGVFGTFKVVEWNTLSENQPLIFEIKRFNISKSRDINWLTVGKNIILNYKNLGETKTFFFNDLDVSMDENITNIELKKAELSFKSDEPYFDDIIKDKEDIIKKDEVIKTCQYEMSELSIKESDDIYSPITENECKTQLQNSTSDVNFKTEGNDINKPKSRRRCSDLHFLEQWGWHKNRRYSSRKKNPQDRPDNDSSLKGFLGRIFSKHFKNSVDSSLPLKVFANETSEQDYCRCCENSITYKRFYNKTESIFKDFIADIKADRLDLISLMFKWLKYMSLCSATLFPEELKTTYITIFIYYTNHIEPSTWTQFSKEQFIATFKICLLFLELDFEKTRQTKCEINFKWRDVYNKLIYHIGSEFVLSDKSYELDIMRLLTLEYRFTEYENFLKKSLRSLENLESLLITKPSDFINHLPNVPDSCISREVIYNKRVEIQRKIALNGVPKHFEDQNWSRIVDVVTDNLLNARISNNCEYMRRDIKTQFELLLQALWNLSEYQNCLIWAEMCLHNAVSNYFIDKDNTNQSFWEESMNYVLAYIETLILHEGNGILDCLGDTVSRLVQNIIQILNSQLNTANDKNYKPSKDLNIKYSWVVLHQTILREENAVARKSFETHPIGEGTEEVLPNSFLVLFTAHDFMGKRQCCTRENGALLHYILDIITPNLRAPFYDSLRDIVYEYLEQITHCLYGFPPKKARSRHIEDHESSPVELTLNSAKQLFDIYRPDCLPEFNSFKLESISADMEQLLLKIVSLMSKESETTFATSKILQFINGERDKLPNDLENNKLPYKISSIYYLLADYYFKNRDFAKTVKYYVLDLAYNPFRLDSWAGMALAKASKIESKLNDFLRLELSSFLIECDDTIRCFEQCRKLNQSQTLLWIEYGSFCYSIYSFCSRHLKQQSDKMSNLEIHFVQKRKENMLNSANTCFYSAATLLNNRTDNEMSDEETHEEKWLCQYMLGKVGEKKKQLPRVYLNYYLKAAHYLYESNATYPIKINHSNPTPLSVEALEVFYRTNSAILKYLEYESEIDRETGDFFINVLKKLSLSPFAYNKAKIDGNSLNALKRKITNKPELMSQEKIFKLCDDEKITFNKSEVLAEYNQQYLKPYYRKTSSPTLSLTLNCSQRRKSNGSGTPGSSTTDSERNSSSSLSTSSNSSGSASESDSDSETDAESKKAIPYSENELFFIYKTLIQNLEECATRFPEHYKSIYRLVFHYMNGPEVLQDLDRSENLLLGQYTTGLGNQINGMFFDRKSNNIFNGIWRLPSSEIDRPGSFSTHMVKCISILIQMLVKRNNHKLLLDIGLQLYKTPDNDKRYIKDMERLELYQQSIHFCIQVIKDNLKNATLSHNNNKILMILIDIYKAHKKCIKYISQKEPFFTQLLIDVYKFHIHETVEPISENLNYLDLAIKFCLQEISVRKNQERNINDAFKNTQMHDVLTGSSNLSNNLETEDTIGFQKLVAEYYKVYESRHYEELNTQAQNTQGTNYLQSPTSLALLNSIDITETKSDNSFRELNQPSQFPLTESDKTKICSSITNEFGATTVPCDRGPGFSCTQSYRIQPHKKLSQLEDNISPVINMSSSALADLDSLLFNALSSNHNADLISSEINNIMNETKKDIPLVTSSELMAMEKMNVLSENETSEGVEVQPKNKKNTKTSLKLSYQMNNSNPTNVDATKPTKSFGLDISSSTNLFSAYNNLLKNELIMANQLNMDSQKRSLTEVSPTAIKYMSTTHDIILPQTSLTYTDSSLIQSPLNYQVQRSSDVKCDNDCQLFKQFNSDFSTPFQEASSPSQAFKSGSAKKNATKTLQQKLVERQKANKSNEKDSGEAKTPLTSTKSDVIILE